MNARIKEIEKQSYVDADAGDGVYQRFSMQKFADLIIEDFLAIVQDELHPQAYAQVLTKTQQHFYEKTTF